MAKLQVDAHFSEPAYPQCRAIQQEVQNSWCMYTPDPMSLLRIQGYYRRFKVITADPKLFLRIKSYYSGSQVIIQDPKLLRRIQGFYFRSNPI